MEEVVLGVECDGPRASGYAMEKVKVGCWVL